MYVVIFKARINIRTEDYHTTANRMRELAINQYHCIDFTSVLEKDEEISLSYWHDLEHIQSWKQDTEHLLAQKMGQNYWYKSYKVQIAKIEREYSNDIA